MSRVNVSLHAAHHVIRASRGVRQLVVDLINVRFGNQHYLLFSPLTVLFFVSFEGKIGEGKLMIVQCPLDIATGLRQQG